MGNEDKKFETWKEVIVDFFEYNVSNIQSGKKCNLYRAREYILKKEKEIKSEKDENKRNQLIIAKEEKENQLVGLRNVQENAEIREWIDLNSKKKVAVGKRTVKATHVLKFTHSSSSPAALLLNCKANDTLVSTSSLKKNIVLDLAHSDGSLITVSRFLNLSLNGKKIFDFIREGLSDFLQPFALDQSTIETWFEGFKELVEEREIKTADMAKQIYFPLEYSVGNPGYHLIIPLFSSSLANELHAVISDAKYGNEQTQIRHGKKKEEDTKYIRATYIEFPNLAVQNFGGSHAKNISMLNANRSGESYLFSAQPPAWQSNIKPPIYRQSMFDEYFFYNINDDIDYLREFLLRFERIDLSIKDPARRKWVNRWLSNIIDEFLFYVSSMQDLPKGWSAHTDIKLKVEHQYLLDPYRDDELFQLQRESNHWQAIICEDFAYWLNLRLKGKDKKFTPQDHHHRWWILSLEQPLREHCEQLDVELKFQVEVEA